MWPWNLIDDLKKLQGTSSTLHPRWIPTAVTVQKHSIGVKIDIKLCASFQSHLWIQTKVTVRKRSIQAKMGDFMPRVTLKFDG